MGVVCVYEQITSKENSLIKYVIKLMSSSKERKRSNQFVLEGFRLCNDAAINGYRIDTLLVSETAKERLSGSLSELEKNSKRKVLLPDKLLQQISDTVNSQGVIAVVDMPIIGLQDADVSNGKYLALENTQDPSNLGAIARTAEALGIKGLIVSSNSCDVFSPKVQRSGMGALLRIPVIITSDLNQKLVELKNEGFKVYASVVSDFDVYLNEVDFNDNSVLLIGNEANGLTESIKQISDVKLTIKMDGKAESLNAAAAAAICMWKMVN